MGAVMLEMGKISGNRRKVHMVTMRMRFVRVRVVMCDNFRNSRVSRDDTDQCRLLRDLL